MQLPLALERYTLFRELSSGGMATVYLARIHGAAGFGRTVAVKRLHPHLAADEDLVSGFVDEARLCSCIHHPNVVPTLDVVARDAELFLILEYVHGESLMGLLRAAGKRQTPVPVPIALFIAAGLLNGLHAAHEARDEKGNPIHIVHRDVSPHNVMVGVDGIARVLDFGIAKAANRVSAATSIGVIKGKVPYMSPEQLTGKVTRQADIYSAGAVLWETLAGRRLFGEENEFQLMTAIMMGRIVPPSIYNPAVSPEVDRIVMNALARDPDARYESARAMAEDIDVCLDVASPMKVAEWVQITAATTLDARAKLVAEVESIAAQPERPRSLAHLP